MKALASALVIRYAFAGCCYDVGYGTNMEECCQSNFVESTQLNCQTAFRVGAADDDSQCGLPTFSMGATVYDPRSCTDVQATLFVPSQVSVPVPSSMGFAPAAPASIFSAKTQMSSMVPLEQRFAGGTSMAMSMSMDSTPATRIAPQRPMVFTLAAGVNIASLISKLGQGGVVSLPQQGSPVTSRTGPVDTPSNSACPLGLMWCADVKACAVSCPGSTSWGSQTTNPNNPSKLACDQLGASYIWCTTTQSCNLAFMGCSTPSSSSYAPLSSNPCAGLGPNANWCGSSCIYGPCPFAYSPTPGYSAAYPISPPNVYSTSPSCPSGKVWCASKAKCIALGTGVCPESLASACPQGKKWCVSRGQCIMNANPCF